MNSNKVTEQEDSSTMMLCCIYRSARKEGAYLYTPFSSRDNPLSKVPEQLLAQLGELTEVMKLKLTPNRKLAQANAKKVMQELDDKGYYLQLPPLEQTQNRD